MRADEKTLSMAPLARWLSGKQILYDVKQFTCTSFLLQGGQLLLFLHLGLGGLP